MKGRLNTFLLVLIAVITAAAGFFVEAQAQTGRDSFSHTTTSHRKVDCGSCHKNPTPNWVSARGYPDVADYPSHDSCIQCHRNEFFRGNRPAICAVCHVNPDPRGKARFSFPVRSRSQEFETIFPHDAHQNIIASNDVRKKVAVAHYTNASFIKPVDDPPKSQFNNCAICHQTASVLPQFTTISPKGLSSLTSATADSFAPKAGFFKDMPNDHTSCFTCHYQGQKPIRTDCAGCHRVSSPYFESSVVRRFSLKFDHNSENHANKDCTTCHVRITQTSDLRSLINADVPMLTCSTSSCHIEELRKEVGKREKSIADKTEIFNCAYCHTTAIGRFEIPNSHKEQVK